jgi:hypothetical protein
LWTTARYIVYSSYQLRHQRVRLAMWPDSNYTFVHYNEAVPGSCKLRQELRVRLVLELESNYTFVEDSEVAHGSCQLGNKLRVGLVLGLDSYFQDTPHQPGELHGVGRENSLLVALQRRRKRTEDKCRCPYFGSFIYIYII